MMKRRVIGTAVVITLLLAGAAMYWIRGGASIQTEPETITYSTDTPDEKKPDKASYDWSGGPKDPKYITLPSVNAEGFVQRVGVDQNQQVAVPSNIHVAGWFVDSVKPGEKGLSIIDGHVDGQTQPAIFKDFARLEQGDEYTISFGDGSEKRFRIKQIATLPTDETSELLFMQDPNISHQVNLITCTGTYSEDQRTYDQRIVVVSELVQ